MTAQGGEPWAIGAVLFWTYNCTASGMFYSKTNKLLLQHLKNMRGDNILYAGQGYNTKWTEATTNNWVYAFALFFGGAQRQRESSKLRGAVSLMLAYFI